MNRAEETAIAEALLGAPGWARAGLTAPSVWTREDAARELARVVADLLEGGRLMPCEQEQPPL